MAGKSMVGEDSISYAEKCIAEQQKGDMDHAKGHGGMKGAKDMGDSDLGAVKKLGR